MKGIADIKSCGLRSTEVLESISNLPIDYFGFVFAESRRQVSPYQAKEMIDFLLVHRNTPFKTAGVFVNPTQDELIRVMKEANLDVIQLHGHESVEFCFWVKSTFNVRLFKVFGLAEEQCYDNKSVKDLLDPYFGCMDAVMLDTIGGGTGKPFLWEYIPFFQAWTKKHNLPLFIAGGLNADNVKQLISQFEPDGVDVSSGVETNGVKDIDKIITFVGRVGSFR